MINNKLRVLVDIGHPGHVHYFKNFIKIMQKKDHKFLIVARNRSIIFDLLYAYNFDFIDRGPGSANILGKILCMVKSDYKLCTIARKFNPDLFLSFGSMYSAHAAKLLRKSHIAFDDTEHAKLGHILYMPFTDTICVPSCYKKARRNQIRFDGYMELCYLHPNHYKGDEGILDLLGIKKDEKYALLRFISWQAVHDIGHKGISLENKIKAVKEFSKYAKVFISAEEELPKDLRKYKMKIPPEKMHDVLKFATLSYGEGATTASESATLGTPAIYVNNCRLGYLDEEEKKYGLIFNFTESFRDQKASIQKGIEILTTPNIKKKWQNLRDKMLSEKIDVTAFMVWFIENYPESLRIMQKNPGHQLNFK